MGLVPIHDADDPGLSTLVGDDIGRIGVSAAHGAIPADRVAALREKVDSALAADADHYPPGREPDLGRVVFLPRYGPEFLDLLAEPRLMAPVDHLLGADCVLYTMTTACNPPGYEGRPQHVDVEYIVPPDFLVGLGVMVTLDDFGPESGSTRFHPAVTLEEPSPEVFDDEALRLEAPPGSVCWFHGRIWHDAMPNRTDDWRHSILMAMVRPWVRQRFDMAGMLAHLDAADIHPGAQQKLGFGAIAPRSYEEYFLPDDSRRQEILRRRMSRSG